MKMNSPKATSVHLSIAKKIEDLDFVKKTKFKKVVCLRYNLAPSTLSTLMKKALSFINVVLAIFLELCRLFLNSSLKSWMKKTFFYVQRPLEIAQSRQKKGYNDTANSHYYKIKWPSPQFHSTGREL